MFKKYELDGWIRICIVRKSRSNRRSPAPCGATIFSVRSLRLSARSRPDKLSLLDFSDLGSIQCQPMDMESRTCRHGVRVAGGRGKSGLFRSDSSVSHALLRAELRTPVSRPRARGGWPATAGPARLDKVEARRVRACVRGDPGAARRGADSIQPGRAGSLALRGRRPHLRVRDGRAWRRESEHAETTRPAWRPERKQGSRRVVLAVLVNGWHAVVTAHWHGLLAAGSWVRRVR
jgi:hypothetical protein